MKPWQVPMTQEAVDVATGSLLWAQIIAVGAYPFAEEIIDTGMCLDVLARCEEHGLEADAVTVTRYVAALVAEQEPEADPIERAAELILYLSTGGS